MQRRPKILVVDTSSAGVDADGSALLEDPDQAELRTARSREELGAALAEDPPAIVLVRDDLPHFDAFALLPGIRAAWPGCAAVALTRRLEDPRGLDLVEGGFDAYVAWAPDAGAFAARHARAIVKRKLGRVRMEEQQLQAQLDASPLGIVVLFEGRVHAVNQRFVELFGRAEDLVGRTVDDALLANTCNFDAATVARIREHHRLGRTSTEDEFTTTTGRIVRRSMRALTGTSGQLGRIVYFHDVTSERIAERQLAEQARHAAALAELRALALAATDVSRLFAEAGPVVARGLAVATARVLVHPGQRCPLHPTHGSSELPARDGPCARCPLAGDLRSLRRSGMAVSTAPVADDPACLAPGDRAALIPGREGAIGLLAVDPTGHPSSPADAEFLRACAEVIGTAVERAAAEAALRRSEERWRLLVTRMPEGVGIFVDERAVLANETLASLFGWPSAAALIGRSIEELYGAANLETTRRRLALLHASGDLLPPQEYTLRRPDGSTLVVEAVSLSIDHEGRPALLTVLRDISERKQLQARMMMTDRMVSVGTLAAGVAHELNNPLAFVTSNVEFLRGELVRLGPAPAPQTLQRDLLSALEETQDGLRRMRRIIHDLKGFSRTEEGVRKPVEVVPSVEAAISIAHNELKHRARLVRELEPVPSVLGDDGRISQVVLNLLINAAQAIPEGRSDRHTIHVRTRRREGNVAIEVADDGSGIPPENLGRIFEPFFTTKPFGVGTGLGLSVCHNIIRALGGTIEVESTVGSGTTVRVQLPATAEPPEEHVEDPRPTPRRSRLMVVDDEPMILSTVARILGRDHDVASFGTAADALQALRAGQRFDVLFVDLMMPDTTGAELLAEIERVAPDQARAVVFITGGAFTPAAHDFLERVDTPRLHKPFDARQLQAAIAEVLSRRSPPAPASS